MSDPPRHRDLVVLVLGEAIGSSLTPFVPLPFVDDWIYERLLRSVAAKVVERSGRRFFDGFPKQIVVGYVRAGASPLGTRAFTAAARFVVRKVAVILDVKRSHDVFGEAIAFALALDIALGVERTPDAEALGEAIQRATRAVGSGPLELLGRAGRGAFAGGGGAGERLARVADAIGKEVDEVRAHLEEAVRAELR